jgi:membrane AbrB-like protein
MDPPTAILASVPGGAVGVVAMTRELGGDDRLVAFAQYLRVLVIVLGTPLIVAAFAHGTRSAAAPVAAVSPEPWAYPVGIAVAIAGVAGGRRIGLPAASMLGPLFLASACSLLLPEGSVAIPGLLREAAFALVGLDVGLRFSRQAIEHARRLTPALTVALVVLLAGCFGLACAIAATTSIPLIDAYLATTPGGLTVVGATAYSSGADTGFVTAIQAARLVLMLAIAPWTVRLTIRWIARSGD